MKPPSETLKERWLDALLPRIGEDGWTDFAARKAAEDAGISAGEQALAAPGGVEDLREAFFDSAEADARSAIEAQDLADLKVHERVALGVRIWLDTLAPHREAVKRASASAFSPFQAGDAAQRCWSVADMVWSAIGDTSDDHNYYTKRGLLASTIPPIVLYWQGEPDSEDLDGFIARRLQGAMQFGRASGEIAGPVLDLISRLRGQTPPPESA